jgi:hypothetical protein
VGGSMSSVVISGDTSGAITLAAPAVSGTNTATLPAATGTVMVSGNMPAFGVYCSATTALANNVDTKIAFDTKEFDTNTNFSTTNYRFTPTVAGYYQINANLLMNYSSGIGGVILYKNGSRFKYGVQSLNNTSYIGFNVSCIVYANGSTDYFEIYGLQNSGSTQNLPLIGSGVYNWFNGSMVRGA